MGCTVEEEENVGKKQKGVDMGLLVIRDRSFVGVTIVQGWLGISENQNLHQWEL